MCHHIITNIFVIDDAELPKATNLSKNVTKFNEFLTRYNILGSQSDVQVFSHFCVGLRIDLEYELCKHGVTDLKRAYALV